MRPRVLVVDDERHIRRILALQLEAHGYEVFTADDGVEALASIQKIRPDLILLDIMMPRMDGYEVCHRLRSDPGTQRLPIVILSAKDQLAEKVKGLELGANDYVTKPFSMPELMLRVRNHIMLSTSGSLEGWMATEVVRAAIFVSYSHGDGPFVKRLIADLNSSGHRLWVDENEIRVGDSLTERIGSAIMKVDFVVAVLSSNSIQSRWVQRELEIAMTREIAQQRVVVLPVIIEDGIELPPFLSGKKWGDFRNSADSAASTELLLRSIEAHLREGKGEPT